MASTLKHLRSSSADKRPTASGLVDGQLAINTASGTPGLFFKDSNNTIVKVGPAHIDATAPNATPAGSAGNSKGEFWVDINLVPSGLKVWNGSAFSNLTPSGSETVPGLLEVATPNEVQTGTDHQRAVTPSGLQSKISNSVSTTSSTTIASSTAVKSAYDLANAALPRAGGTLTGQLLVSPSGSLAFEGSSDDGFETTLAVVNPTAARTITFPNVTGDVVTTGDSGTVTSTMIANNTIVDADINPSAAIAYEKLALASGIVNGDISGSAEIAVSKLADGAARQLLQTDAAGTGVEWTSNVDIPGTLDVTGAAVFDSTANIAGNLTVDTDTLFVDSTNNRVGIGTINPLAPLAVTGANTDGVTLTLYNGVSTDATIIGNGASASRLILKGGATASASSHGGQIDLMGGGSATDPGAIRFRTGTTVGEQLERARLDSSGKLLVGADSDWGGGKAQVANGSINIGTFIGAVSGAYELVFEKSRSSTVGTDTIVSNNDTLGQITFKGGDGSQQVIGAAITGAVDGTPGANRMPGELTFSTATDASPSVLTTRMIINSSGRVGIGRAPTQVLDIYRASGSVVALVDSDSLANGDSVAFQASGGARSAVIGVNKHAGITNPCGYIALTAEDAATNVLWADNSDQLRISTNTAHIGTTSGTVVGTQTSDERLKNILGPVEYGLETLKQINPVRYSLKSEPDAEKLGFIAQQVQPLIPQSVFDTNEHIEGEPEDAPTKLGMEYVGLIPVLVNAIKELSAEVDALKAQLQAS